MKILIIEDEKELLATMKNYLESEGFFCETAVINTLKTGYAGYTKDLIEIYESPEINGFELGLKKGEASIEVIFDNTGKVIKKAIVKEENEKEEKEEEVEK